MLPPALADLSQSAFTNDLQFHSASISLKTLELNKAVTFGAKLPVVLASFNYGLNYKYETPVADGRTFVPAWTFGLQATMPIDSLIPVVSKNFNQLKEAELQIENAKLLVEQLKSSLRTQALTLLLQDQNRGSEHKKPEREHQTRKDRTGYGERTVQRGPALKPGKIRG